MAMTSDAAALARGTTDQRDARGYWRVLLAICAPLGWLAVGLGDFVTPYELGGSYPDQVQGIAEHQDVTSAMLAFQPLFTFTFVPGVIAFIIVCRRARPVFTALLGTLGLAGALAGTANPKIDLIVLEGLREGIGADQLAGLADRVESSPSGLALVFTLLFITFGRIALGMLLWRAGVGPRWCAVLMAVSPFIEFVPVELGNAQPALSWCASGVAMLGVSLTLLRMPNAEFDLPPVR